MENTEILARFAKAREFEVTLANGWRFLLRLPTDFQERKLALEARGITGEGASQHWLREMLREAVFGWSGPTLDDLLHEGDRAPLPFSKEICIALLESDAALMDEVGRLMHAERLARRQRMEAAAKNSASA